MPIQKELSSQIRRQHILGCKIAIAINLLSAILDVFIIEENTLIDAALKMTAAVIITIGLFCRKRISREALGMIPMLATLTAFAYTYNSVELETFRKMTYLHIAVFIGAGMFLLWNIRYSIMAAAYALIINTIFYLLFSNIPFSEYMIYGGFLLITVAVFMVLSIEMRYKLVENELMARLALQKSEEELRLSEEQHRLLFDQNPIPMMIVSPHSIKILAVNGLMISKYGYSREEFMQMSLLDLHRDTDIEDVMLCAEDALDEYHISEWIHVLKDKTEINVEVVSKFIEFDNESARLISIYDITEVKRYQEELIAARSEAEKSKELQSQFLSNMSHEIRTPMNGIVGITRILQNTEMDDEQRRYLNAIQRSSENLMVIINDILDFSKIEAGKIIIEHSRFDLRDLLNSVQEILAVKAVEQDIYLDVNVSDAIPQFVVGDPVRLNQILINLAGNAIKFTNEGGVTIRVSETQHSENKVGICFEIRDTGIGIAPEQQEHIFQSFAQASASTTRTHGGTGLGLTISRQLIELQDGQLWIESEVGKGSTFYVELEYEIAREDRSLEPEPEASCASNTRILEELNGINVLLVEDHPINQMLALKVLGDWDFQVDVAENGRIALDMVGSKAYDLILMDISMPEMDGYDATRAIRSGRFCHNPDVPIIAMTASALIGENQKCFRAGMNDYITKPFDPQHLLEKIFHQLIHYRKSA